MERILLLDHIHALSCELQGWRSKPCTCQQQIKVCPFEQELGYMIDFRVLQQTHGADGWERIVTDYWLDVIVEVNNVGFPEA